ncbi:DNA helicase [Stenotrophomonas phage BUCT627]|uniref:DNA helicase n=1 Tax=Stenotrophomonas phage BUCT627 TaxID=2860377 RepID=A0AC61NL94_9CAUD|nr:DNA helicase [Stenotrophomonas phage BUCT627]QYC96669.1 DNA helicase [Stenotrophomonas phage BUCT627]
MKLRHYQQDGIDSFINYFMNGGTGNPLMCFPTGTGKSVILAGCIREVLSRWAGTRILALVHVKELVGQNYRKFEQLCPDVHGGIYSAGLGEKQTEGTVIFGGVASVVKKMDDLMATGPFHLVFVDEAHMISPNDETMYRKIIEQIKAKNPAVRVIGLTATPWRPGLGRIDDEGGLFTETICDWTSMEKFNQLITEGFLCPLIPFSTELVLNVDGVKTRGGDFVEKDLQDAVNRDEITRAALTECLQFKDSRKSWLIFGAGVDHCLRIAEMLNEMGVSARAVWSSRKVKMVGPDGLPVIDEETKKFKYQTISCPDSERDAAIADFKRGDFQAIVSNGILTTGFDHPPVDMIVMLRPTKSVTLWIQMLGRGTRPFDPMLVDPMEININFFNQAKLNTLVLDFARNTKRLGCINDPYIPNKKGKGGGTAPIKECPLCMNNVPASAKVCPGIKVTTNEPCNYEFPVATAIENKASEEELIKGNIPEVNMFRIDHISYEKYRNPAKGTSLKISYSCGNRTINEFVCIEYADGARKMAERWMRENLVGGFAASKTILTVNQLLNDLTQIKTPTHIRVVTNERYPRIVGRCWDGSGFGTEAEPTPMPAIDGRGDVMETLSQQAAAFFNKPTTPSTYEDDDIPF